MHGTTYYFVAYTVCRSIAPIAGLSFLYSGANGDQLQMYAVCGHCALMKARKSYRYASIACTCHSCHQTQGQYISKPFIVTIYTPAHP